jgi:hypothetical protein
MPTAAEYDEWASWFVERADEVGAVVDAPFGAATPAALAGGFLASTVDVALVAAADNATAASARLRALSDECTRRAEVCRQYDEAMRLYESNYAAYERGIAEYGERARAATEAGGSECTPVVDGEPAVVECA